MKIVAETPEASEKPKGISKEVKDFLWAPMISPAFSLLNLYSANCHE